MLRGRRFHEQKQLLVHTTYHSRALSHVCFRLQVLLFLGVSRCLDPFFLFYLFSFSRNGRRSDTRESKIQTTTRTSHPFLYSLFF